MKRDGLAKMILLAGLIVVGLMVDQANPGMGERMQAEAAFSAPSPIERFVLNKG